MQQGLPNKIKNEQDLPKLQPTRKTKLMEQKEMTTVTDEEVEELYQKMFNQEMKDEIYLVKKQEQRRIKAYYQRPYVKAKNKIMSKAYYQRPDIKAKKRITAKKYYEENKEKMKAQMKANYRRKKLK